MNWTLDVSEASPPDLDHCGSDTSKKTNARPFESKNANCAPHHPAKIKTTKINWEALRRRYVMGVFPSGENQPQAREWPSLADVAREFGASIGRVEAVSAAQRWPEQRGSFRQCLRKEEDHLLLQHLASTRSLSRIAMFDTAMRGLALINTILQNKELSPSDLFRLSHALQDFQEVTERAIHGSS